MQVGHASEVIHSRVQAPSPKRVTDNSHSAVLLTPAKGRHSVRHEDPSRRVHIGAGTVSAEWASRYLCRKGDDLNSSGMLELLPAMQRLELLKDNFIFPGEMAASPGKVCTLQS